MSPKRADSISLRFSAPPRVRSAMSARAHKAAEYATAGDRMHRFAAIGAGAKAPKVQLPAEGAPIESEVWPTASNALSHAFKPR